MTRRRVTVRAMTTTGLEVAGDLALWAAVALELALHVAEVRTALRRADPKAATRVRNAVRLPVALCDLVAAVFLASERQWVWAGAFVLLAALGLDRWWKGSGRRRAARLAAQVADLGHRLVVVQVGE